MAVALAEKIGGTESRFAAMMTLKAQELGMSHTRYVNANGLPDSRQVTTAHDIAILCRAVLRDYPQYYHYFGRKQFTYRGRTMSNHNHLLGRMPGVDGFKTGFTNAAGYNLAASAVRNGHRLIAVVHGRLVRRVRATPTSRTCCSPASTSRNAATAARGSSSPRTSSRRRLRPTGWRSSRRRRRAIPGMIRSTWS